MSVNKNRVGFFAKLFSNIRYFIYPCRCISCDKAVGKGEILCDECKELWEKEKHESCRKCGRPHVFCTCLLKSDEQDRVHSVYHLAEYKSDSIARKFIISMKRRQNDELTSFIASEMCRHICLGDTFKNSTVTYVPRKKEAVRETGSDQAKDIAEAVCRITGNEFMTALQRKGRVDQKTLDTEGRRKNAKNSYTICKEAEDRIKGKVFFLIDDVITTGSTMVACAEILLQHGADKVVAISVGRRT